MKYSCTGCKGEFIRPTKLKFPAQQNKARWIRNPYFEALCFSYSCYFENFFVNTFMSEQEINRCRNSHLLSAGTELKKTWEMIEFVSFIVHKTRATKTQDGEKGQ